MVKPPHSTTLQAQLDMSYLRFPEEAGVDVAASNGGGTAGVGNGAT